MRRPIAAAGLVLIVLAVLSPHSLVATGGRLSSFLAAYPSASGTKLNSCLTCHTSSSGGGFNSYGSAVRSSGFAAIEGSDSDGDGFTNLEEIQAGTFPGNSSDAPAGGDGGGAGGGAGDGGGDGGGGGDVCDVDDLGGDDDGEGSDDSSRLTGYTDLARTGSVTGVALATDTRRNEVLAVWGEQPGNARDGATVRSLLVRSDGTPRGGATTIARGVPGSGAALAAAYGNRRYLVTFAGADRDILGAIVRAGSNRVARKARAIGRTDGAAVPAYSPDIDQFLVAATLNGQVELARLSGRARLMGRDIVGTVEAVVGFATNGENDDVVLMASRRSGRAVNAVGVAIDAGRPGEVSRPWARNLDGQPQGGVAYAVSTRSARDGDDSGCDSDDDNDGASDDGVSDDDDSDDDDSDDDDSDDDDSADDDSDDDDSDDSDDDDADDRLSAGRSGTATALAAWLQDGAIHTAVLDGVGEPIGRPRQIGSGTAGRVLIAAQADGSFLVVWTDARSRRVWAADVNPSGRSRAPFELQAVGESVDPRVLAVTRVGNRVVVAYAVEGSSDLLRVASVAPR